MRLNRYLGIANMLWTKKKRMIKHEKVQNSNERT